MLQHLSDLSLLLSQLARFFRAGALRSFRVLLEITGSVMRSHARSYVELYAPDRCPTCQTR
jgi:hypothetical protein